MTRTSVTVEEVANDPTNAYEVTVHGDVSIKSLKLKGEEGRKWVNVEYANGGGSSGCPAHWASYVRITGDSNA